MKFSFTSTHSTEVANTEYVPVTIGNGGKYAVKITAKYLDLSGSELDFPISSFSAANMMAIVRYEDDSFKGPLAEDSISVSVLVPSFPLPVSSVQFSNVYFEETALFELDDHMEIILIHVKAEATPVSVNYTLLFEITVDKLD